MKELSPGQVPTQPLTDWLELLESDLNKLAKKRGADQVPSIDIYRPIETLQMTNLEERKSLQPIDMMGEAFGTADSNLISN